ncbi:MAG TPA: hypothetical protein VF559_04045 [Caulobacteraceae bacterium]|jgi:hypothetical protein
MARLKVFASRQGFFDTVVAAPSQAAALEAWGTHQNLFAQGVARVTDEPEAVEAALARPGQVLRRAVGSGEGFTVEGGEITLPELPNPPAAKSRGKAAAAPAKPAPDRGKLDAAEAALTRAEAQHAREAAGLERERERLAREMEGVERRMREQVADAERDLRALRKAAEREREAYRRAGGE